MTVQRDIEIVQGQTWTELFIVDDLVSSGNGLRMHIRDNHGATLLRAALAHDNAANERISFATGGILANLGASISTAWDLQGQAVRRWVYSIERYSLSDVDDVTVHFAGTAIIKSNPTDESSITAVAPHPSYDESCLRFDVEQTLTEPQKSRARSNAGFPDGGALAAWGGIGGALADQSDLVAALAAKADTSHSHSTYLAKLAIGATDAVITTISTDGATLSRSAYTTTTLIAAGAAAAPVQSVAGRTGAVVIAVGDVSGAEATANKAQANGYASLDSGGKVPQAQIPAIAITEYLGDVASQVAMLALSGQKGDWCTRSDSGATWIITGTDPTLLGSWTAIVHPTDAVTSVAGRTGAVTLSTADVSGLGTAATHNVPASGNAASGEVVKGSDTRLDVAATVHAATEKTTIADDDEFWLIDSAASWVLRRLKWSSIKTALNALYQAVLVSGTNIKTINSTSLLGSGDIAIGGLTGFTAAESTSSPNATVPVASLTANNAATNVDAALCPKGSGAVLADLPDSTATGGNKRGANAVDWQTSRTTAAQVASGANSTICGGTNNTASGSSSTVYGGTSNTASGFASIAAGNTCTASATGATVLGGSGNTASGAYSTISGGIDGSTRGIFSATAYAMQKRAVQGDRQTMTLPITCAARTDATATVLTSDAGSANGSNQMVLPNNSAYMCTVEVVALDPGGILAGAWEYKFLIKRGANAASTAIVGTPMLIWSQNGLSGGSPGIAITADTTYGCPKIEWTGIAATTTYPLGFITARQCA